MVSDADKKTYLNNTNWTYEYLDGIVIDHYDQKNNKPIPSKYKLNEPLVLQPGEYHGNKEPIKTTLGRLFFNKIVVEASGANQILGYVNETVYKGTYEEMCNALTSAVLTKDIPLSVLYNFLNYFENFFMRMHAAVACSFTITTFKPIKKVMQKKEELFKKYEKELDESNPNNMIKMVEIENELIDMAKGMLKDDPGMMLYNSKANASFDNNYKNTFITRGVIPDPNTGKNHIVKNCYAEGVDKKDIPSFATAITSGSYPKAVGTATSGYLSKNILAIMQNVRISDTLHDCGSKQTVEIKINDPQAFIFKYIVEDGKNVLLTPKNINKYDGKVVKLRSPMFCIGDKDGCICEVCAGTQPKNLGIKNIGLTASIMSGKFTNLSMKKFHDATIKLHNIDINDIIMTK